MRARYVSTGLLAISPRAVGAEFETQSHDKPKPYDEEGSIAVIHITGPLEQHPNFCWLDYETLQATAQAAFDSTARAVALKINSPGGSAAGCFELSRALRAMSLKSRKPLAVFVDGMACSAAYAIACSATGGICAPPTSTVASLAVYEMMVDASVQDSAMGMRFVFVPSTGADLKLAGNPHVPPSEAVLAHTQGQVDLLTDYFYSLIEEMRGIPKATIAALRGATLLASQGLENSLLDEVTDWGTFLAKLQTSELMSMPSNARAEAEEEAKTPWQEAIAKLAEAADGEEDEGRRAKAKKALMALMKEDEAPADDKDKPKEGDGAKGEAEEKKAEAEEKKAKAEAEEKKAKAEAEEKKAAQAAAMSGGGAQASANELALAKRVHALEAERAAEKDATARAQLLAQRPDWSSEVQKTFASLPISVLEDAVKTWPRVHVDPRAAARASMPGTIPGKMDGARPHLNSNEMALLDRMDRRPLAASSLRVEGSSLIFDPMSSEAAAKRMAEMIANGDAPGGPGADFARISNTEFRQQPVKK